MLHRSAPIKKRFRINFGSQVLSLIAPIMGCINNPVNGPARLSIGNWSGLARKIINRVALLQTETILNAKKPTFILIICQNLILISSILFIVLNIIVKSQTK
jgi:hypothetical protein